jgi:hypothetical protein
MKPEVPETRTRMVVHSSKLLSGTFPRRARLKQAARHTHACYQRLPDDFQERITRVR